MDREQIVKALDRCARVESDCPCDCPFVDVPDCIRALVGYALALVREQAEEIEQKDETIAGLIGTIKDAYGFAVRKMQERLKACTECVGESTVDNPRAETYSVVREDTIDQIAKEMLEEG